MERPGLSLSHSNFGDNARVQVGNNYGAQQSTCLQDLFVTNPAHDKKTIESRKGGLKSDFCKWIFESSEVHQWREDDQKNLLRIHGDPGKGKTMLLCHAINVIEGEQSDKKLMAWFFCQASDRNYDNAVAVLRGLVWMLANQEPTLVSHIEKCHRDAGARSFTGSNAFTALSGIFSDMLDDLEEKSVDTYILIDALDECQADVESHERLLDFITTNSTRPRLKWLVTSRNILRITEQLQGEAHNVSLELNKAHISKAVQAYIDYQLDGLAKKKEYSDDVKKRVHGHLTDNAKDTFLWVSLVCEQLRKATWTPTIDRLHQFPPGLDDLYSRVLRDIIEQDSKYAQPCIAMISLVSAAFRPLYLAEILVLFDKDETVDMSHPDFIREVVKHCTSILTIDNGVVYLVHQSASDYLHDRVPRNIVPKRREEVHLDIFYKSVNAMNRMKKDMYELKYPGTFIGDIHGQDESDTSDDSDAPDDSGTPADYDTSAVFNISADGDHTPQLRPPLDELAYSCVYWIDHLEAAMGRSQDEVEVQKRSMDKQAAMRIVDEFLKKHFLHWLEASSLLQSIPRAILSLEKLLQIVINLTTVDKERALASMVNDAKRFTLFFAWIIEDYPLQVYVAGLVFSPTNTFPRNTLEHKRPKWILEAPKMPAYWDRRLYLLQGHMGDVTNVTFSHDSRWLASGDTCGYLKIWNAQTGQCFRTIDNKDKILSLAISPMSKLIATVSDVNLNVWSEYGERLAHLDIGQHPCKGSYGINMGCKLDLQLLQKNGQNVLMWTCGHIVRTRTLIYSGQSWNLSPWRHDIHITGPHITYPFGYHLLQTKISPDGSTLVNSFLEASYIYDINQPNGPPVLLFVKTMSIEAGAFFSPDSSFLAISFHEQPSSHHVQIWARNGNEWLAIRKTSHVQVSSLAFSSNPTRLAILQTWDLHVLDVETGTLLYHITLSKARNELSFSPNGTYLAIMGRQDQVMVYDLADSCSEFQADACLRHAEESSEARTRSFISSVASSQQRQEIATIGKDGKVSIWNLKTSGSENCSVDSSTLRGNKPRAKALDSDIDLEAYNLVYSFKDASSLVYSPQGKFLLCLGQQQINVRNMVNGKQNTIRFSDRNDNNDIYNWKYPSAIAFTPDESFMAVAFKTYKHMSVGTWVWMNYGDDKWKLCREKTLSPKWIIQGGSSHPDLRIVSRSTAVDSIYGLDNDREWIVRGSEKLLWLPHEYRPWATECWTGGVHVGSTCTIPFCDDQMSLQFLVVDTSQGNFFV